MRPTHTFSVRVKLDCDHLGCASDRIDGLSGCDQSQIISRGTTEDEASQLDGPFSRRRVLVAEARTIQLSLDRARQMSKGSENVDIAPAESPDSILWAIFVPPSLIDPNIRDFVRGVDRGASRGVDKDNFIIHGTDPCQIVRKSIVDDEVGNKKDRGNFTQSSALRSNCCPIGVQQLDAVGHVNYLNSLLPKVHPSLSGFSLRGIVTRESRSRPNSSVDYDLILIKAHHGMEQSALAVLEDVQGESMAASPHAVIKAFSVSCVSFDPSIFSVPTSAVYSGGAAQPPLESKAMLDTDSLQDGFSAIPSCPTCIHRIEPQRLGMPKPKHHQLCSHLGPAESDASHCCSSTKFLNAWPHPSYCETCEVISKHMRSTAKLGVQSSTSSPGTSTGAPVSEAFIDGASLSVEIGDPKTEIVYCFKCKMKETLWVCLTCGVVGCGRYSHGHAEEHYNETRHPYSLELATQRIWDYATGDFVQRDDLLSCPLMQRRLGKGSATDCTEGGQPSNVALDAPSKCGNGLQNQSSFDSFDASSSCMYNVMAMSNALNPDDPSPKKASMIGEEYEALLQSALEDQAQHYEFEITRLIAELTGKGVDEEKMSGKETAEIEMLQSQISELHMEVDRLSRDLLDKQAQEAGHRATYQRLHREQAVAKDLLDKIKEESERERVEGDTQVAELEQQVMDLTANLRMREQIALDEELSNAQIFGVAKASKPKRGKKIRRAHIAPGKVRSQ